MDHELTGIRTPRCLLNRTCRVPTYARVAIDLIQDIPSVPFFVTFVAFCRPLFFGTGKDLQKATKDTKADAISVALKESWTEPYVWPMRRSSFRSMTGPS